MDIQKILFTIAHCAPGFLLAIIMHEYAHGYVAKLFGDSTAERAGRLTFNPSAHIDPMGTILWPLIGAVSGWAVFGWAKPVPISVANFPRQHYRKAIFWVSFAGPLSNFILGTISAFTIALWIRFAPNNGDYFMAVVEILKYSVFINFLLGGFNIIPWPPLDGSRMLASFLKGETLRKYESLSQYTLYVFIGIFALSMMGVPTIHYILEPFLRIGNFLTVFFVSVLS